MSRPRPPYLHRTVTRHKKLAWYFWKRPGPKIRIYGDYGSREFMAAYKAALSGEAPQDRQTEPSGTFGGLIALYRQSPAWTRLADATRRTRGNMLDRVRAKVGHLSVSDIDRAMIAAARDDLKPGAAKCLVDTLRGLFKWAKEAGHVDDDPTEGVKVADAKTDGFRTWTPADIAAYEARWPVGTKERLWLAVLLFTGLRLSDAIAIGNSATVGGTLATVTQKTGTPVMLPLHPELKAILDASPLANGSFIGMSANAFDKAFRRACRAAGVKGSAHGLRKAAATRLAEAGASVLELNAVFGWTGSKMAMHYCAQADRAKLAKQAMLRLSMFSPSEKVGTD